jgi:hypothetical protein
MTDLFEKSQESERIYFPLDLSTETQESEIQNKQSKKTMLTSSINVTEQFNGLLIEAIDEALASLGEPVKNTLYQHLAQAFKITKKNIPNHIEEFSQILHKIFGLGASRLEIKFMRNLNTKIKANIKWKQYEWPLSKWIVMEMSFEEYIRNIRIEYEKQSTTNPSEGV